MGASTIIGTLLVTSPVIPTRPLEWLLDLLPTNDGDSRLLFNGKTTRLHIFDLELHDKGRMVPVGLSRMPEDAEAISTLLPERMEPCRDLTSHEAPAQKAIRIFLTQDLDSETCDNAFGPSPDSDIRRAYDLACSSRGYHGMSNQWRRSSPEAWFEAPSCLLSNGFPQGMMITIKKACVLENSNNSLCRE